MSCLKAARKSSPSAVSPAWAARFSERSRDSPASAWMPMSVMSSSRRGDAP